MRPALVAAALAAAGGVVVAGAGAGLGGQSRAELTAGDLPGVPAADQPSLSPPRPGSA